MSAQHRIGTLTLAALVATMVNAVAESAQPR